MVESADGGVPDDGFDEVASINSEIRYLTLELMKLAVREGKSFDDVSKDFVQNTFNLYRVLTESQVPAEPSRPKRVRA